VATRIRLARGGKRHRPYYRIVVADSRRARDGKFIERIGSYDPLLSDNKVTLDAERAKHWLNVGAKPSHTVSKLLALQGVEHKLVVTRVAAPATAAAEPAAAAAKPKGKAKAAKAAKAGAEAKPAVEDKPAKAKAKAAE
jgi:small subunit ribosomal protein S16